MSGELYDKFHFDWCAEGQLGDANGGAGVLAVVTEDLNQEVTGPIDDRGLSVEPVRGGDKADDFEDAGGVEVPVSSRGRSAPTPSAPSPS